MAGFLATTFLTSCQQDAKPEEALTPVTFEKVTLDDEFWLPRLELQKETLIPFSFGKMEPAVENIRRIGEYLKTGKEQPLLRLARFVGSDLFKVMEGAAYLLSLERDPELEKQMDEIIDLPHHSGPVRRRLLLRASDCSRFDVSESMGQLYRNREILLRST